MIFCSRHIWVLALLFSQGGATRKASMWRVDVKGGEALRATRGMQTAATSNKANNTVRMRPNETQDQRPLARARVAAGWMWKSSKAKDGSGQRFAASPG